MTKPIFLLIFLIAVIERIFFTFKKRERPGDIKHKLLSKILIISYLSCIILSVLEFLMKNTLPILAISLLGFFITLIGIILRDSAIKALGGNWSLHIKDIPDQKIVFVGPYKWIRHPYYTAVILELLGVSLFFNSIFSIYFLLLIHLPIMFIRIRLEEKFLIDKFQTQYINYLNKTRMFLPKWRY